MQRPIGRRGAIGLAVAAGASLGGGLASPRIARAETTLIRIGVLTDLNGPNAAANGNGSVTGAKLAAEDFMAANPGVTVEVIAADYQSKPDVALTVGRDWIDRQGVDVISNVNNSAAALAIVNLVREKDKVALLTGPASSDLTGKACSPNHVHWVYDTYALGKCTGGAMVAAGGTSWFFIAADYTFGHLLRDDTARFVTGEGGQVLGTVYTPFPETTDFSAFLLQAQASGAKVVGLANSGTNTTDCIKQAAEFGLTRNGTQLAALLMMIPDLHGLGLQAAQGLVLSESFYWDMNDGTRAYAKRFAERMGGYMPSMIQAGDYSAVTHYLKCAKAMGYAAAKASGKAAVQTMKATPTDDPLFGKGTIRADGRKLHPMYLFQVKSPAESKYPWDYYKLLRTVPPEQAFRPLSEHACPMLPA
ncbi:MAG: ABC transporter substrate-binding protein [Proteobacteria bacterium]|nr:ABC transporter substrate-binding protein [Pseudomonadota bacterium]